MKKNTLNQKINRIKNRKGKPYSNHRFNLQKKNTEQSTQSFHS